MIQIPIGIQAANYGLNMLSVEERELTADFLLTKPVKRSTIFKSQFLAVLTSLMIVNVFIWISSLAVLMIFKGDVINIPWNSVIILLSTIILFQLYFVGIGMLITMLFKKIRSVIPFSMCLGFYIINSLVEMFTSNVFKALSPFAYFNPNNILINGTYNIVFIIVSVILIIGTLSASYFLYLRRNIASL